MAIGDGNLAEAVGTPSSGRQSMKTADSLQLPTTGSTPAYSEGSIVYDLERKLHLFDTGYGVRIDAGEVHIPFFNDTGVTISNGAIVNVAGASPVNGTLKGILADASNLAFSSAVIGVSSSAVLDQEVGLATLIGKVSDIDTSSLTEGGIVYLSETVPGGMTNTRPLAPNNIVIIGSVIESNATTGLLQAKVEDFERINVSQYDAFSSQGAAAGTFYTFGTLDWSTTSTTLTQASATISYGAAGRAQAAHAGIVPSGPGTVDTGQVGLRVTGTLDNETFGGGGQVAAQTRVITDDITTLTADTMAETEDKFSGDLLFELYVVSGAPTTYSLTFNYGFSKYNDFFDRNATIRGFEARWWGDANDSSMEIELVPITTTGWTYAATGFIPGATPIIKRLDYQAIEPDVDAGAGGAWKVKDMSTYLESSGTDGIVVRITTTAGNTFLNCHFNVFALSEELT